jgi:hypothetical protein
MALSMSMVSSLCEKPTIVSTLAVPSASVEDEAVLARAADQRVEPVTADQRVLAGTAVEAVAAGAAAKDVDAEIADDDIGQLIAGAIDVGRAGKGEVFDSVDRMHMIGEAEAD